MLRWEDSNFHNISQCIQGINSPSSCQLEYNGIKTDLIKYGFEPLGLIFSKIGNQYHLMFAV